MTVTGSSPEGLDRPLRADAARNRARILDAARELFAEHGLAVTMDEIARHAGVGVGTAYRRFPDREALIKALFEDHMDQVVALVEEAEADPDPWHGFVSLFERFMTMQVANRGLKELLFSPAELRERIGTVRNRTLPVLERLIARAQASGDLRPDLTATDVLGMNFMLGAVADLGGDIQPDLWRRYLAVLLDGLRARRETCVPLTHRALEISQLDAAMAACHQHQHRAR